MILSSEPLRICLSATQSNFSAESLQTQTQTLKHTHLNTSRHTNKQFCSRIPSKTDTYTHIYTFRKASLHTSLSSNASMMFLIPSERSEFFSNPLVMLRKVSCDAAKRHCLVFDIRGKTLTARFPRFDLFAKEKIRNAPDYQFQNTSHNDIYLPVREDIN